MIHSGLVVQKRARFENGFSSQRNNLARYVHEIRPYVQTAVLPLSTKKYSFDAQYNRSSTTETSYGDIFGKRTTPDERLYFYDRYMKSSKPAIASTSNQTQGAMPPPAAPGVPPGNIPGPPSEPPAPSDGGMPPMDGESSADSFHTVNEYLDDLPDELNEPPNLQMEIEAANVVLNTPGSLNGSRDSFSSISTEALLRRIDDESRDYQFDDSSKGFRNSTSTQTDNETAPTTKKTKKTTSDFSIQTDTAPTGNKIDPRRLGVSKGESVSYKVDSKNVYTQAMTYNYDKSTQSNIFDKGRLTGNVIAPDHTDEGQLYFSARLLETLQNSSHEDRVHLVSKLSLTDLQIFRKHVTDPKLEKLIIAKIDKALKDPATGHYYGKMPPTRVSEVVAAQVVNGIGTAHVSPNNVHPQHGLDPNHQQNHQDFMNDAMNVDGDFSNYRDERKSSTTSSSSGKNSSGSRYSYEGTPSDDSSKKAPRKKKTKTKKR